MDHMTFTQTARRNRLIALYLRAARRLVLTPAVPGRAGFSGPDLPLPLPGLARNRRLHLAQFG